MNDLGKLLMIAGLLMAVVGALLWSGFGKVWLGRLPGDINYSKGDFNFNFPIVTCLIVSAILTLLMWLFRK
jgi:membrane protein implicated in regulation of membrane protease activity